MEIYRANLDNKEFYTEKFAELEDVNDLIVFNNYIIYIKYKNELIEYDINKDAIKEIISNNVGSFNVVDHFVYYNLYNDKIIYRYDVDTQKTETFFEFKKQDKFQPKVYYINRMIIIKQMLTNLFILTSTILH